MADPAFNATKNTEIFQMHRAADLQATRGQTQNVIVGCTSPCQMAARLPKREQGVCLELRIGKWQWGWMKTPHPAGHNTRGALGGGRSSLPSAHARRFWLRRPSWH